MNALLILAIIIVIYYCYTNYYDTSIKNDIEQFTTLNGLNPLTTYDDYGTFNFLLHTNDLPYYDPTYAKMGCCFKTYDGSTVKKPCFSRKEVYDEDSFINYNDDNLRREVLGSNYADDLDIGSSMFGNSRMFINLSNPKISSQPPSSSNWKFSENILV